MDQSGPRLGLWDWECWGRGFTDTSKGAETLPRPTGWSGRPSKGSGMEGVRGVCRGYGPVPGARCSPQGGLGDLGGGARLTLGLEQKTAGRTWGRVEWVQGAGGQRVKVRSREGRKSSSLRSEERAGRHCQPGSSRRGADEVGRREGLTALVWAGAGQAWRGSRGAWPAGEGHAVGAGFRGPCVGPGGQLGLAAGSLRAVEGKLGPRSEVMAVWSPRS